MTPKKRADAPFEDGYELPDPDPELTEELKRRSVAGVPGFDPSVKPKKVPSNKK